MTVAEQISAEETLANTLEQYAGKWIAVARHQVVESAETLQELEDRLGELSEEASAGVEVFRVAEDPNVACFF